MYGTNLRFRRHYMLYEPSTQHNFHTHTHKQISVIKLAIKIM